MCLNNSDRLHGIPFLKCDFEYSLFVAFDLQVMLNMSSFQSDILAQLISGSDSRPWTKQSLLWC